MASSINSFQPTFTTKESLRNGVTLLEKNESKRTKDIHRWKKKFAIFSKAINFRDKSESKQINWQLQLFLDRKYIQSLLYVQLADKSVRKQRSKYL